MDIQAKGLDYRALNEVIRAAGPSCRITGCLGQRFIGAGMSGRRVERWCTLFGGDAEALMDGPFTVVTPDSKNPYRQMYAAN